MKLKGCLATIVAAILFVPVTWTVPRQICGRHAHGFHDADEALWTGLADEVVRSSGVGADRAPSGRMRSSGQHPCTATNTRARDM